MSRATWRQCSGAGAPEGWAATGAAVASSRHMRASGWRIGRAPCRVGKVRSVVGFARPVKRSGDRRDAQAVAAFGGVALERRAKLAGEAADDPLEPVDHRLVALARAAEHSGGELDPRAAIGR